MSRKHSTPTPEASASQLLSELREMNRETRETMADLKLLLKQVKEAEKNILDIVADISEGRVHQHIEEVVEVEIRAYAEAMAKHTEEVKDQITERLTQMTAALVGLPAEVFSADKVEIAATRSDFLPPVPLPPFTAGRATPPKKT